MKKLLNQTVFALAALISTSAAQAASTMDKVMDYATLGVWADAPLGVAARVGLAIPVNKDTAITIGNEFGLYGNKQFVGARFVASAHGVAWGGVDLARWKTRSHPWLADANTEYYGLEAQLLVFRAGLMVPNGGGHSPKLTLGVGLSY